MFAQLINRINRTETQRAEAQPTEPLPDGSDADPADPLVPAAAALFATPADDLTEAQRDFIHVAIDWVDAPLGFFDRDLVLRFANVAYCTLLDLERDASIGRPIDDVSIDGQGDDARAYAERALAGESLDIDIAHRRHGAIGDLGRLQYRPQRDVRGRVLGVLCVLHRLGRRRADQLEAFEPTESTVLQLGGAVSAPMRAALRIAQDDVVERERKQRELIEGLPLPLMFIGNDGLCKWVNRTFCDAFAVAEHAIVGRGPDALSPAFAEAARVGLAEAAAGRPFRSERVPVSADRSAPSFSAEFRPGFDRENVQNGVYVLLTVDDGASPVASGATRQAIESEAGFRSVADRLPETIVFVDRQCVVRYVNDSFVERSGRRREQMVGRPVDDALGVGTRERFEASLDRALAGEAFTREGHGIFGDRTEWREAHYIPLVTDGAVTGVCVVSRSLEGKKRAERAVQ